MPLSDLATTTTESPVDSGGIGLDESIKVAELEEIGVNADGIELYAIPPDSMAAVAGLMLALQGIGMAN